MYIKSESNEEDFMEPSSSSINTDNITKGYDVESEPNYGIFAIFKRYIKILHFKKEELFLIMKKKQ